MNDLYLGEHFIWHGNLISVDHFDQLNKDQNDVIYEVIRIIGDKPLFLEDHLLRFLNTFQLNAAELNQYKLRLTSYLRKLIKANNHSNGNIRFQFNNNQLNNFCAWYIPAVYPTTEQYNNGVRVTSFSAERTEPHVKARNINLRNEADKLIAQHKVYEVILVNSDGEITEGSRSNIFFTTDNCIVTPPLGIVLPGITRQKIMALIKRQGMQLEERNIYIDEILNYTGCFISGTSPKILPVNKFDELFLDAKNPLLQNLMQLFEHEISNYLSGFKWAG